MYIIPSSFQLFDSHYKTELPIVQVYIATFNKLPSQYTNGNFYKRNLLNYLIEDGFSIVQNNLFENRRVRSINENAYFLINYKKQIAVQLSVMFENADKTFSFHFFYNIENGPLEYQVDMNKIDLFQEKNKKSNIHLVVSMHGSLDTQQYDLPVSDMNLELNYGKNFLPIHNTIEKRLNENFGKGIILLHGEPGTGKTSYLKYLTKIIKEKDVLFIPPSMAESLSDPAIIPFLMEKKNSILIIEDAEKVISDREHNGSSAGVSNILNLTDGILGDCLNIQIIATFNMKKEKIDGALLRKGRLIAEHKFSALNVNESNILLKYLKKDFVTNRPMTLSDIYNIDVEVHKSNKEESPIGFK